MTKADKLLARMRQNPGGGLDHSGHRAALQRIGLAMLAAYGWRLTLEDHGGR